MVPLQCGASLKGESNMAGILEDRVAIVTGAGRGLGREHALELARQGAKVVVNDLGTALDGAGVSVGPAQEVVEIIQAAGGQAVANGADIADFTQARELIEQAVSEFGRLDVLVNNAGFVRDRMLVNAEEDEWDAVIRVHLKGHFATLRHAAAYWRTESKEGRQPLARVINTSSGAGLQGSIGQAAYSAAKGGIASMTLVAAAELDRYGVAVNAIAPSARTRMTEGAFAEAMAVPADGFDRMNPENVSPLVAWLASTDCTISGRVLEIEGGRICLEEGWNHGSFRELDRRWEAAEIGDAVRAMAVEGAQPESVYGV